MRSLSTSTATSTSASTSLPGCVPSAPVCPSRGSAITESAASAAARWPPARPAWSTTARSRLWRCASTAVSREPMSLRAGDIEARLSSELERVGDEVVSVRRDLHRHPELSHEERRTADVAATRCAEAGYAIRGGLGGDGVIADIDGADDGITLMIRADMDALPVQERDDGRAVRSDVDGVMHACGHDGHVAMALGAGAVLMSLRDSWRGRVRLCFQPAEERAEGAVPMIEAGAADGVDRVLGVHLWAPLQAGHVAVTPGVLFGSADSFTITVRGRGGHGGMPHTAVDPVVASAQVILALQTIVSRETSPFSPAVVTLGKVSGGTAFNVIADSVLIEGTVRAMEQSERER